MKKKQSSFLHSSTAESVKCLTTTPSKSTYTVPQYESRDDVGIGREGVQLRQANPFVGKVVHQLNFVLTTQLKRFLYRPAGEGGGVSKLSAHPHVRP